MDAFGIVLGHFFFFATRTGQIVRPIFTLDGLYDAEREKKWPFYGRSDIKFYLGGRDLAVSKKTHEFLPVYLNENPWTNISYASNDAVCDRESSLNEKLD